MSYRYACLLAIAYCIGGYFALTDASEAYPTTNSAKVARLVAKVNSTIPIERVTTDIVVGSCPGATAPMAACVTSDAGPVYVDAEYLYTEEFVAHEIGHLFDGQFMNEGHRRKISRVMGLHAGVPWEREATVDNQIPCLWPNACGKEWFADGFAACAMNVEPMRDLTEKSRPWTVVGPYELPWSPRIKKELCRIIDKIGRQANERYLG